MRGRTDSTKQPTQFTHTTVKFLNFNDYTYFISICVNRVEKRNISTLNEE